MGSLSADRPKHLLEVAGEPLIVHQLRWLSSHAVVDVVLATSHLAEQFEPVLGDGSRWGVRLRYSTEPSLSGTAGALRLAAHAIDSRAQQLVVVNGDLLTEHDLTAQLAMSAADPAIDAVLHLRRVPDARLFGSVVADAQGHVSAFVEKSPSPPSLEVNAGTYVLARSVVDSIPEGVVSLEHVVLPALIDRGRVVAYREHALWEDVGSPPALVRASRSLVLRSGRPAHIDPTAVVDPGARVTDGSAVGPFAVVEAGARVVGSVVMTGAVVGADARVEASALAPGARVPRGGVITGDVG